jgi:hypothetical protein
MTRLASPMPLARSDGLVVEELPDEVLVYDLRRYRAYCLNRTTALVWRHCDGRTTVSEAAARLAEELTLPVDEGIVWMALDRLARARLLREPPAPVDHHGRYSRRDIARRLALAGGASILLPVVSSILVPTAVEAAFTSCTRTQCRSGTVLNSCAGCLNKTCSDVPTKKCTFTTSCDCR